MLEEVILVDQHDQALGCCEKIEAHEKGLRHRAFSIFVFRKKQEQIELLLQQRQYHKYHSPGLWTNTCCGHPRPGENVIEAGLRRLKEELGFNTPLTEIGMFHYIARFENGLTENEMDHILCGYYEGALIEPDPEEVATFLWMNAGEIEKDLKCFPEKYTMWFAESLNRFLKVKRN